MKIWQNQIAIVLPCITIEALILFNELTVSLTLPATTLQTPTSTLPHLLPTLLLTAPTLTPPKLFYPSPSLHTTFVPSPTQVPFLFLRPPITHETSAPSPNPAQPPFRAP